MKRINFKNTNEKILIQGAEIGIWQEKLFVPIESIQLLIFESEEEPIHWIAYSPMMQWAYISRYEDDFTKFLETKVQYQERHQVEDGKRKSEMFYLANNLFFHYSYRTSLLLDWQNTSDNKKKIKNKLWIETYSLTQGLIGSEGPDMKTWEEDEILNKGPHDFSWGGFYKQEEKPERNPITIIFMVIGAILGLWMGCQNQEDDTDFLFEVIWFYW